MRFHDNVMFEHVAIAHQYCIILCSLPSSIHTEPILCECYQQSPSIPVRLAGAGGGADPKRTEVKDGFFRVKDCFSPTCLYNSGKSTGVLYGPKSMGYFGVPSGSLRGPPVFQRKKADIQQQIPCWHPRCSCRKRLSVPKPVLVESTCDLRSGVRMLRCNTSKKTKVRCPVGI